MQVQTRNAGAGRGMQVLTRYERLDAPELPATRLPGHRATVAGGDYSSIVAALQVVAHCTSWHIARRGTSHVRTWHVSTSHIARCTSARAHLARGTWHVAALPRGRVAAW